MSRHSIARNVFRHVADFRFELLMIVLTIILAGSLLHLILSL